MNTLFDLNGECRHLSDMEVLYNITNSSEVAQQYNTMLLRNEVFTVESLFENMTPGRKQVAVAAIEMYKRLKERTIMYQQVRDSRAIYKLMLPLLGDLSVEEFWLILLNNSSNVIKKIRVSTGGITGTFVDVRLILKHALMNNATCIAVVHNHPSGNARPSGEDKIITQNIKRGADTMNIRLIDHVIVCDGCYFSFSDEGIM